MKDRFQTFTVLIGKINREIKRIKTNEVKELGLKSPHVSCLYYLYKEKYLTSKELTDICEEDKASVSRTLDFLKKNGYIVLIKENDKKYRNHLTLTDKGVEVASIIADKIDNILALASAGLSEEDRVILYRSLNLISENLKDVSNGK